jgi:hypothetical protein
MEIFMASRRFQHVVLTALVLAVSLFSCQSNDAQKHTLAINGVVHVYRTETPPAVYPGDFIDVLGPKDHVEVMQVHYKQGCVAVRIKLADGREGWVFSGESIELIEPLAYQSHFRSPVGRSSS